MAPMSDNEQRPLDLAHDGLAMILHTKDCPVEYKCLALDCIECLQIYMDRGAENG